MKKLQHLVYAVSATLALAACAKLESADSYQTGRKTTFVTISACLDSEKATLEDGSKVFWSEGDQITVWDGTNANTFTLTDGAGSASGTFAGEVTEGASYVMVYPASAFVKATDEATTITVPSKQTISAGVIDPAALVCTARTTDLTAPVSFKNAVSLVKFQIAEDGVTNVVLAGNGSEKCTGTASVAADGTTVTCSGNEKLSISPASGSFVQGTYYAAIAPANFTGGIKLAFSTSDQTGVLSTPNAIEFVRNGGKDLGNITGNAKVVRLSNVITTKEQLQDFRTNAAQYITEEAVKIGADIDMAGEEWVPVDFGGVLDGQNYTISNLTVETDGAHCGVFGTLTGEVRNLNVSGGKLIAGTEGEDVKIGFVSVLSGEGSIHNVNVGMDQIQASPIVHHAGGIVGYSDTTGEITGCINSTPIVYSGETSGYQTIIGGIVGYSKTTDIEDCENTAEIDFSVATSGDHINLGGIVGYIAGTTANIDGCANSGYIHNSAGTSSGKTTYLGGIIGRTAGVISNLSDCINSGKVESRSYSTRQFVGGIVGFSSKAMTISGCKNVTAAGLAITANSSHGSEDTTQPDFAAGGIVGFTQGALTMTDCDNEAPISNSGKVKAKNPTALGGIVGGAWNTSNPAISITECTNTGSVSNSAEMIASAPVCPGGIIGRCLNGGTIDSCTNGGSITLATDGAGSHYLGGICAINNTNPLTFENCTNEGDIENKSAMASIYIGGICGASDCSCTITECINTASVKNSANISSGAFIGGLIGNFTDKSAPSSTISGINSGAVLNTGVIKSYFRIGGICGNVAGKHTFKNCTNSASITNDSATIGNTNDGVRIAGIVACSTDAASTFENCFNTGDITSKTNAEDGITYADLGGINAYSGSGSPSFKNCISVANVKAIYSKCGRTRIGGMVGYTGGNGTYTDCICKCNVNTEGTTTTLRIAQLVGSSNGSAGPTVKKTGIAGTYGTITLTAENWADVNNFCGYFNGNTGSKINISGDADSCYYYTE